MGNFFWTFIRNYLNFNLHEGRFKAFLRLPVNFNCKKFLVLLVKKVYLKISESIKTQNTKKCIFITSVFDVFHSILFRY